MRQPNVWPEIDLDRSPQAPSLRRQIAQQIASAIRAGNLPNASRLPSSRLLAKGLNVSRGTILDAYDALLATGALIATTGSGIHVAQLSPTVPNFTNLKHTIAAAHYPARTFHFEDPDGAALYLNVIR